MNINKWIAVAFLAFFLAVFFFFLRSNKSVTDLEGAWLVQPVEQTVQERIWREITFYQSGISEDFLSSSHMSFGPDGFIYAGDNREMVVKKYDSEANLIEHFGLGEGEGPGEFFIIQDLLIDHSGYIWTVDERNSRATVFNPNDKEDWQIIDFTEVPNRVIPAGDDGYWFEKWFDNQLRKYSFSRELISKADPIVDDPSLWFVVLESYYAPVSDGGVVLTQYHTNHLLKYSSSGEIEFFRKPVSTPDLPRINPYYANEGGRSNTVDFSSWRQVTRRPFIVENTFHVYIFQEDTEDTDRRWKKETVDVYNLENGDYLYSYKLPDQLLAMTVSSTRLAGIPEELGQLVVWEVEGGWN